jgi:hypothetical protein
MWIYIFPMIYEFLSGYGRKICVSKWTWTQIFEYICVYLCSSRRFRCSCRSFLGDNNLYNNLFKYVKIISLKLSLDLKKVWVWQIIHKYILYLLIHIFSNANRNIFKFSLWKSFITYKHIFILIPSSPQQQAWN